MSLRLVIGRSGTGKTALCLREIAAQLRGEPDGPPLIALVPEQATFQTEYALLQEGGLSGTIRAQALSFRRLAFRVMQETGGTALVPIGDGGKHMLLYKLSHLLSPRFELFRGGEAQPGFVARLAELLTEWKRHGVAPGDVEQLCDGVGAVGSDLLRRKLHDLALVYDGMERELEGRYMDAEDYLARLRDGFADAASMRGAHIWVDGFFGFTPAEYEALGAMMASAQSVTIALTLDRVYGAEERPHELDLFHPTAETCGKLLEWARRLHVPVSPVIDLNVGAPARFKDSPMLRHLEKHFGGRTGMSGLSREQLSPRHAACGVSLHAAASRRAEMEAVARDMAGRAKEDGLRWRDMAVLVRGSEEYADDLPLVLDDYGIPYFIDQKESAAHHPLVEFIRSALEAVLHGWRYDALFRCIKTEMLFPLDDPLTRDWFDLLENYALAAGIDGWKWLSPALWKPLASVSLDEETDMETAVSRKAKMEFDIAIKARDAVIPPLERFGRALGQARDVEAMCAALYRLLEETAAADRLEQWSREDAEQGQTRRARSHRLLWDSVIGLLDQLVELAGEEKLPAELFAGMVEAGLDGLKLAAVPPALDQVMIGSIDRTRFREVKVCYVLGANDGVLPTRIQEDGVLSEAERDQLAGAGVQMAPGARRRLLDERFLIYNALTTPSAHLWISWTLADGEGKSLLPSEVVRQLTLLFPGIPVSEAAVEPTLTMPESGQADFIVHPQRSLSYLIAALRGWKQGASLPSFWWELYNWYAARTEWQAKLGLLAHSLVYDNKEVVLPAPVAASLYGVNIQGSVSRMERFVACPFQHFAVHGLKLRERKLYRLEAPDVGQLFHAALSRLAIRLGERWGSLAQEDLRTEAAAAVAEIAPRLQAQILLSSGRFQYIARKLTGIVAQAAVALGEQARRARFHPVGTEVGFGPGGVLPALSLELDNGATMDVIGRIDRVDAAQTEEGLLLRVMDYKSSQTSLRLDQVAFGLSLQMLAYLDVLISFGGDWLGKPVVPAGALYFHVHNPLVSASNRLAPEKAEERRMKRFKMRGLVTAEADVVKLMDDRLESGHSDILPVALKRDGGFYSSSSVVTAGQWSTLQRHVRSELVRIGKAIQAGDITIAPYRLNNHSPCQFCDYKSVCQFDPLFEGNEYRKFGRLPATEAWTMLEGGGA